MINGIIKLFYSEVVKVNIKKMPNGEYSLKDEYKKINNLTLKIDNLAFKIIKFMSILVTLFLVFQINIKLGIGLFLIGILYIIYKKNLEKQVLDNINNLKNNINIPKSDILSDVANSGINILTTFIILGFLTSFNWSIVISFIVVFLFTIKDIYSNIKK